MLKRIVEKYNYISFDIFDTLIFRAVHNPHRVFELVYQKALQQGIQVPDDFAERRIQAERMAAGRNRFYNIFDIYDLMDFFHDENAKKDVIYLEFNMELDVCHANEEMVDLFNQCLSEKKTVIITSDMYWPKEYLIELLRKNGIVGFEHIFVSCEQNADKAKGDMYKLICRELKIAPKMLVHIGDNKKSDFLRAKLNGVNSYLYDGKGTPTNKKEIDLGYLDMQSFIDCMMKSKYSKDKTIAFRLGYSGLGPLLYGYVNWLDEQFKKDGIEKAFFLSRDGKIMELAYEAIGGNVPHCYMYASRKALIVPTIHSHPELNDALNLFFKSGKDTYGSILEKMGVDYKEYLEQMNKHGLNPKTHIRGSVAIDEGFQKFYQEIKAEVIHNSERQEYCLKKYLDQIGFSGKVAVVDIGWFGNMQKALNEVCAACNVDAEVYGYYLGIRPDSVPVKEHKLKVRGFLFEQGRSEFVRQIKAVSSIVEYVFSTTHGSLARYGLCGEKVVPLFETYEYSENSFKELPQIVNERDTLVQVQNAALSFIRDIKESPLACQCGMGPSCYVKNLLCMCLQPTSEEVNALGDLRMLSDGVGYSYLARPSALFYYLIHPRAFKKELKHSLWRIGFFKRLVKISLPYDKIYFGIRKMAGKKD